MSRAEDAARRAELEAAAVRAEAAQAQVLIDAFLAEAKAKGIAPVPLRATSVHRAVGEDRQAGLVPAQQPEPGDR